jgi:hypothetical protein
MDKKEKFTKSIVIRITDEQYRRLLDSVRLLPSDSVEMNNKSQVIREMMNMYLVPNVS